MACLYYLSAVVVTLATALYFFFRKSYSFWKNLGVPYVPGKFIFGSLKDSTLLKITISEEISQWYNDFKSKGHKFFGVYSFHQPLFIVIDTELVKNILSKDFNHFVDRGGYYDKENDPLTAHLFSLNGLEWKHLRQRLTPTFTTGKLKMMFQTLVDCTNELETCLDGFIMNKEAIDIKRTLAKYTINVIGSCAFGVDCNSFKDPNSEFVIVGEKAFRPPLWERIRLIFAFTFPKIIKFFKIKITNHEVDRFFRTLVKETIEYREKHNIKRNDFMQLLIQLKNKGEVENSEEEDEQTDQSETIGTTLTVDEAAAQAFLFFIAGFETTSSTMTLCLYELAKNQEIQERAREEVKNVLKKHDGKITYYSLKEMHYLERIILETLRLHPPVGILQREVTKDYEIPNTNLTLKKKLPVFIPVMSIQRDPEYYPEPERFDPERFTEEGKATRPDFTWLPFGEGPRVCIGLRFGLMQAKVGICRLLCNYKFTNNSKTQEPLRLDPENFINAILGGVWLNAEKITS